MKRTKNNYIETYSGNKFYVLDPQPEDIRINDIGHALSMICRFTGHGKKFYSVAEHSIYVSQLSREEALWGLLHDASEAYLADIASPVKPYLSNYKELETNIMKAICEKFGIDPNMPEIVHNADMEILRVEAEQLMVSKGRDWAVNEVYTTPLVDIDIKCYTPEEAKIKFLEKFYELVYE